MDFLSVVAEAAPAQRRGRFAILLRFAVQGGPSWPTRSTARRSTGPSCRSVSPLPISAGRSSHRRSPPPAPALRNPASLGYQPEPSLARAFAAPSQLTRPAGAMIPSRRRTGTSSPNWTQASSLTSVSPGNRHLLPHKGLPPLISRQPAAPALCPKAPPQRVPAPPRCPRRSRLSLEHPPGPR